jgi:glyoxylase-like metal-dependent hydrolase (beta-lactamase superfamily II)
MNDCVASRHLLPRVGTLAAALVFLWAAGPAAQGPYVRATKVQGHVYVLAGAGGNVAMQVGSDGIVLVDSGDGRADEALLTAVRTISSAPIQYVLTTGPQPEHVGGNEALRKAGVTFTGGNALAVAGVGVGATVISHENTLARLSAATGGTPIVPQGGWPTDTFFVRQMDLFVNDEPIELIHLPRAASDGNVLVHFRASDVIATGDAFRLDTYPVIDARAGGTIAGAIAALNRIIDITVPKILQEGGTMVVPGHGRIGDESDVVEYRDMVTIIRDRVADAIKDKVTLDKVKAAKLSRDYDGRFAAASGPASSDGLVELIYRELSAPVQAPRPGTAPGRRP